MIELLAHRIENETLRVRNLEEIVPGFLKPLSHIEMFKKHKEILGSIPESERYNLHYKLTNNSGEQDLIPVDIDKIPGLRGIYLNEPEKFKKLAINYRNTVAATLNLDASKLGVIFSGNGLHILIQTDYIFFEKDIRPMRDMLKHSMNELNYAFALENLEGYVDIQPFRTNGTLRFPGSIHIKNEVSTPSELLQIPQPQEFNISGLRQEPELKKFTPDTEAVIKGCDFLNHCRVNSREIPRNQWFLMLGILRHLKNGEELAHTYSSLDAIRYKHNETQKNLDDWQDSGPPLCSTVSKTYSKCKQCPHFQKDTTALMLKDESSKVFEAKLTGFREIIVTKNGTKKGRFLYKELAAYFVKEKGDFIVTEPTGYIYQYNGKYYEEVTVKNLQTFAFEHMDEATSREAEEFAKQMRLTAGKQRKLDDLMVSIIGKVNFKNGIFDSETGDFFEHDPKYFFQNCIESIYSKDAQCPTFEKFLDEIASQDDQIKKVLLEFFGMTLANAPSRKVCKALFLIGEGSTGKSTFLNIMKEILGKSNTSAVDIGQLNNEQYITNMVGKSANISFEMSPNDLRKAEKNFKAIVAGDSVFTKLLYQNGYSLQFNTKLIVACNALPPVDDSSNGVFRRLLIVPLKNIFSDELGNIDRDIMDKILDKEIPGIVNLLLKNWRYFKINNYRFTESKEMINKLKIVREMNPIINFSTDYIKMDKLNLKGTKIKALYSHYVDYCKSNGRSPKNKAQLITELTTQIVSTLHIPEKEIIYKNTSGVQCVRFVETHDPDYEPEEERF